MKKYVFIFGAGASKDEGLPIQEELLYSYFQNQQTDQFRPIISKYFNDLKKLYTNANNTHERLMQALFLESSFHQDEYGFISFNYDLLLDKALMNILEKDIYVDYGITFANETIFNPPFAHWESPGERCIRYLKPHGSFNWMHCPTCNSMYITGVKESRIFSTGYLHTVEHCLKDKTELSYVMHPPSLYFKTHRNIYVQLVWKHTYDLLADADKVYFIGYALKDADVWMKYNLKKSQVQKSKDFIVVNPQPASQLHEKFERLLGDVTYLNQDFSTFVDCINDHV